MLPSKTLPAGQVRQLLGPELKQVAQVASHTSQILGSVVLLWYFPGGHVDTHELVDCRSQVPTLQFWQFDELMEQFVHPEVHGWQTFVEFGKVAWGQVAAHAPSVGSRKLGAGQLVQLVELLLHVRQLLSQSKQIDPVEE